MECLLRHGIEAQFTGCLTLTLSGFRSPIPSRRHIYLVDALFNFPELKDLLLSRQRFILALRTGEWRRLGRRHRLLTKILSPKLLATARVRRHVLPSGVVTDDQKFALAERYLNEYADARLVITSRIHCALPCLAMGVPVIFINAFHNPVDNCRFGGILDLLNRVDLGPDGEVSNNFGLRGLIDGDFIPANLSNHLSVAADLKRVSRAFISGIL
jgi:hypothetical protein